MKKIHQYLDGVKEKENLSQHTTLRIGGDAEYFYNASASLDLLNAVRTVSYLGMPYEILAGGSNVLVSDSGYSGLIIKSHGGKFVVDDDRVESEAGVSLASLVMASAKKGLTGLEWASGIPGTIGGAIFGNAGSLGMSMSDVVKSVSVYNKSKDETKTLSNKECEFGYRDSVFKKGNLIILRCELNLSHGDAGSIMKTVENNIKYKKENHPSGYLSAGFIFKNIDKRHIKHKGNKPAIDFSRFEKVPAGLLVQEAGFKGYHIGDAIVSDKHANFILNKGNAKADQMTYLINMIKQKVNDQFGVVLEEEIRYI